MTENNAEKITENVQAVAGSIVAIKSYLNKGEFISPLLPKEEADEIRAENRQAMALFAGHVITTLLNPQVAELALKEESKYVRDYNIYNYYFSGQDKGGYKVHNARQIGFDIKADKPAITFSFENGGHRPSKEVEEHYLEFQHKILETYVHSGDQWKFEVKRHGDSNEDYRFLAIKDLEPADLTIAIHFFHDFLKGSRRFLERALREINEQTIPEDEAERLKRITQACLEGSILIEKVISLDQSNEK